MKFPYHKVKGCYLVFRRARIMMGGLTVFSLLLTFVVSCDPVHRHKILTFFFDGVPSLEGEAVSTEDSRIGPDSRRRQGQQVSEQPGTVWFVHEANKNCTNCHEKRAKRRWALSQAVIIAPVPELCYGCHTDYPASQPYVHGPVAVGECLLCHEAHKSKIAGLLKEKEPRLCYQCHETIEAAQISAHPAEPITQCTNCHDPHAGLTRMLLKK